MADAKLSDLTALAGADAADGDLLYVADVSATTSGSKKMTLAEFFNKPTIVCAGAVTVTGMLTANGGITVAGGANIVLSGTTGTKLGTGATQKLGFWNAAPVVQPAAVADAAVDAASAIAQLNNLLAKLRTIGIIAT